MISRVQKKDIVTCVLLSIITCGIYTIFWNYQMGKRIFIAQQKRNLPATDNSAVYLILSLLKFDFISYILIQSELNRLADFDYSK